MYFKNRNDAGKKLAERLVKYKNKKDTIILAIPRGSLQIGFVLAKELKLPLDIIIVKKIPHPSNPEYAIGAVGINESIVNEDVIKSEGVSENYINNVTKELTKAIEERYKRYRGEKSLPDLKGKIVILIDDGIATGYTMLAGVNIIRKQNPKKIVLAVPVAPPSSLDKFKGLVDELICLETPDMFSAIGEFYEDFSQVEDKDAIRLLKEGNK